MKKLMNLAIASYLFEQDFGSDYDAVRQYLKEHEMDGLEIILYGDYDVAAMPRDLMVGHHLLYWPNWLDLWHGDKEGLIDQFENLKNAESYYGFSDRLGMIDYLKNEFEFAKALQVDYMVLHVSHVAFEEVFTFQHKYDDRAVMQASLELINEVFQGDGPLLLFENLWWPGLNYRNRELTKWFYEQVDYSNKGFLLDIAHLMGTDSEIVDVESGITSIHSVLDDLGDLVDQIKGIHMSKTIAGPYLKEDHTHRLAEYRNRDKFVEGFGTIYRHIKAIDSHQPFDHPGVMEIIGRINPEYLVYEFAAGDIESLGKMLRLQNGFIR